MTSRIKLAGLLLLLIGCRPKEAPPVVKQEPAASAAPIPSASTSASALASASASASALASASASASPQMPTSDCPSSPEWDKRAPLPESVYDSKDAELFELTKAGAPAGYAWVQKKTPSDGDGCAIPKCVTMTKRVATIAGPITDVSADVAAEAATEAEAWDAGQGPCSYQFSALVVLRQKAPLSVVVDSARMKARKPRSIKLFDRGDAILWRSINDGMDPWGGLTDSDIYALDKNKLRRVLHVPNSNHTCWEDEARNNTRVCKNAIFDLKLIEKGAAPFIEVTSEVGATGIQEQESNVEIGRYRWDLTTKKFRAEGKPRHEKRKSEMVDYSKRE